MMQQGTRVITSSALSDTVQYLACGLAVRYTVLTCDVSLHFQAAQHPEKARAQGKSFGV